MYNILIPTDFSDNATKAMLYAVELFGTDTKYTLVNGYEVPHSGANMLISIADILEKDALQLLNDSRDQLLETHPDLQGKVEVRAVMGMPSDAVRKLIDTNEFDLVVMGTKGATGLKEVFLGSVASSILSDVNIPVIAVPESAKLTELRSILFAADDKCLSEGVLPKELEKLCAKVNAEVIVLNVVPEGESMHVGNSESQVHRPDGIFNGVKHHVQFIESDNVNKGIESFMAKNNVDMLAMITRKNDLFSRLFSKSNTREMVMHTHIPIFAFH